jgi:2-iminobutanoate/2-iminopropanoate deaminase
MENQPIRPDGLAVPTAPYSSALVSGDLLFLAGQVPFDEAGNVVSDDFADQARQVFDNMARCLEAAGCGFGDVVKVIAYLADFGDFPAFNEIYRDYFSEPYPVRTTVPVPLVGFAIEVDAIARRS